MGECRLLILTAMVPEGRAVARRLRLRRVRAALPLWVDAEVAVAVVGMRAVRLGMVETIAEIQGSRRGVVMAGLAGGLASELHLGGVVIDAGGNDVPSLVLSEGARVGRIYTSAGIVAKPQEKARLLAETGCIAVDMETAIVRRAAVQWGMPFLAVRAISDTVRDTLDPAMLTLVDADGKPRVGAALRMMLREPGKLREMLRLKRAAGVALGNLAGTVELLAASGWPGKVARKT